MTIREVFTKEATKYANNDRDIWHEIAFRDGAVLGFQVGLELAAKRVHSDVRHAASLMQNADECALMADVAENAVKNVLKDL